MWFNRRDVGRGDDEYDDPDDPQATSQRRRRRRVSSGKKYPDPYDLERQRIADFGATWLKPPGVTKTLFQIREERREQEEHAEALRREQATQQLADAEAGGLEGEAGEDAEDGVDAALGERDLDYEIPDADAEGFGLDGAESSDEDDEDNDGGEGGGEGGEDERAGPASDEDEGDGDGRAAQRREVQQMRAHEDRVREIMARSQARASLRDAEDVDEDEIDDEDRARILEEDDLVRDEQYHDGVQDGGDLGMDADLDEDIPEAESGAYEHTDSEADLSSDDDDEDGDGDGDGVLDHGRPGLAEALVERAAQFRSSLARSDGHGIDISSLLSRDGSSRMGSSPQFRRRS